MESKIPELHNRIIVLACLQESVEALITNDYSSSVITYPVTLNHA
jgi:hypothetical protein